MTLKCLTIFITNHSFCSWYKLGSKPEKSGKTKKPEKERGELEIRVDFIIKPKAGSMMDLSMKSKEKSLSLRNLKEKMSIKGSIGEKLLLKKPGQPKYSGENQVITPLFFFHDLLCVFIDLNYVDFAKKIAQILNLN